MKKILIAIMAIISFIAIGIDGWYIWMINTAPDKIVSQTFNVGYQEIEGSDGSTEKKPFIELNMYDNVFEVVFNYVRDEEQDAFYSKGIQYVSKTNNGLDFSLTWNNATNWNMYDYYISGAKYSPAGINLLRFTNTEIYYYNAFYQDSYFNNLNSYQYASSDGFESTLNNDLANPLTTDTLFRIQLGDGENSKLYGMKLKGDKTYYDYGYYFDGSPSKTIKTNLDNTYRIAKYSSYSVDNYNWYIREITNYYETYVPIDLNYFVKILYNSISGVEKGTSQDYIFNFGDYFDYYEYDGKSYSQVSLSGESYNKVMKEIQSYYVIRVNVHDGDMTKSSQSIMGMLNGSANINPGAEIGSYLYGKTVVKAEYSDSVRDFDLVSTDTAGTYMFSLKTDFKDYYDKYANNLIIVVDIDLDYLSECGITFGGFVDNSFGNFKVEGVENYA